MAIADIQTSFAAGELSPNLYARVDLAKYAVGAALLRNFLVDFRGGSTNRPGTQFVGRCNPTATGQPRLLPFVVATEASYVVEVGNLYMRFFSEGAPILEPGTTITGATNANPGVITDVAHGYANGDEIQISGVGGMVQLNGNEYLVVVIDADHYSLTDLNGVPINTTAYGVYTTGGIAQRIYTVVSPYVTADLPDLKYVQSADVMTITHPSYLPYQLTRTSFTTFTLVSISIGAIMLPPTGFTGSSTIVNGDWHFAYGYLVTAVSLDGTEESLASVPIAVRSDIQDENRLPDAKDVILSWTPTSQPTSSFRIYKWGPMDIQTGPSPGPPTFWGYIGSSQTQTFLDNNIAPDYTKQPPQFTDPFSGGQIQEIQCTGGGAGYNAGFTGPVLMSLYVPLTITGDGTGAAGYAVVEPDTQTIVGAYMTSPGKNYTFANITAVGLGGTAATFTVTISNIAPLYPSCCSYFQQRQVFAGSNLQPSTLNMSQTGNYLNFDVAPIVLDSDAINMTISANEVDTIESLVPVAYGLIVFTTGGTYLINGGTAGAAISPASATAQAQASSGANALPPLRINYSLLYVQNKGNVVRDLSFAWQRQSYTSMDISTLASHLFAGFTLTEWAWSEEPFRLIHIVRNDGQLLILTYVPDQDVYAWSHADTNGLFVSVASIPEDDENVPYVIVERYIRGDSPPASSYWAYFVERFTSRIGCCVYTGWFVDAGLAYGGAQPDNTLLVDEAFGSVTVSVPASNEGYDLPSLPVLSGSTPPGITSLPALYSDFINAVYYAGGPGGSSVTLSDLWVPDPSFSPPNFTVDGEGAQLLNYSGITPGTQSVASATTLAVDSLANVVYNLDQSSQTGFTCVCIYENDGAPGDAGGGYPFNVDFNVTAIQLDDLNTLAGNVTVTNGPTNGGIVGAHNGPGGVNQIAFKWTPQGGGLLEWAINGAPTQSITGNAALDTPTSAFLGLQTGTSGMHLKFLAFWIAPTPQPFPASVGDVINTNCAQIVIESVTDSSATGTVLNGPLPTVPNDPFNTPIPIPSGYWSVSTPTQTVGGLSYLEGMSVTGIADGLVISPRIVTGGEITLDRPATAIIVGLGYQCQAKTLYLDMDGLIPGSIQGKRKLSPAVTLRLDCTLGLKVGSSFDRLTEQKDMELVQTYPTPITQPVGTIEYPNLPVTGDLRTVIFGAWSETGEICVQLDYPLPASLLGIIAEVVPGDTQR